MKKKKQTGDDCCLANSEELGPQETKLDLMVLCGLGSVLHQIWDHLWMPTTYLFDNIAILPYLQGV
jgi:hypothetical protein